MRIISGQVSALIRNSTLLSESAKAQALARDIEHAMFFESAGARAIYCIGGGTTHMQFVGVHAGQRQAITEHLLSADEDTEVYAVTRSGAERLAHASHAADIAHSTYQISGLSVLERSGPCIAQEMQIRQTCHGAEVSFEPGPDYRATATELAALRMIALHECMKRISPFVQVTSLLVGKSNVTRPSNYKGPLSTIAGLGQGLPQNHVRAPHAAPAPKRRVLPWYELA